MRVIAMFRVSTEKQANEGASLDAQQRTYREIAQRQGWSTVAEFRGCESATQAATDRRVLQEVLQAIRTHQPDALYVHEQSRLSRGDELDVAQLFRELRERRVKILVGGVVRDLDSIDERFMLGIQSLVDRAEAERIKERHTRGKIEKAKQGKKNSGPTPIGYRNPFAGNRDRGVLQVVPEEAAVVRQVFELAASGLSTRAIAAQLNRDGVSSPRHARWGKTTIVRILHNPAYIGVHVTRGWIAEPGSRTFRWEPRNPRAIWVENAHVAIVSRELWHCVHGRTKRPCAARPRLLTGLLWVNNAKYGADSTGGVRYYCDLYTPGRAWLEADRVDEALWDGFVNCMLKPEFVQAVMDQAAVTVSPSDIQADIRRLEGQLAKHCKRLNGMIAMRADGELSRDHFNALSEELKRSIEALEATIRLHRNRMASLDIGQVHRSVEAVRMLLASRTRLDINQKRRLLESVVSRFDVKAVRTPHRQERGQGGRLGASTGPRWRMEEARATLVFGEKSGDGAPSRTGHLGPARSCSARRAPARP